MSEALKPLKLPGTLAEAIEQLRRGDLCNPWTDEDILMFKWGAWTFAQIMNGCFSDKSSTRLAELLKEALAFEHEFEAGDPA